MTGTNEIPWMDASAIAELTSTGQVSVTDVAEAMIGHVDATNPAINAAVDFVPEQIRRDAADFDATFSRNEHVGPLFCDPFTIKDLTAVKGRKLTFGMAPMKDNVADHDAVIIQRLRAAGRLFIGKTN